MKIAELNDRIGNKNEIAFIFEFKNISNFVNQSDNIFIFPSSFKCHGLEWNLRVISEDSKTLKFYLVLLSEILGRYIKVDGSKLTIINQEKKFSDWITNVSIDNHCGYPRYTNNYKYKEFKESLTYDYLKNNGFIKDDKIILQFYMKAQNA